MIKIVCTTQKEKTELIEASQYLASLKNIDPNLKSVAWLVHLYKNPGDIEIMEDGINVHRSSFQPQKKFGVANKLFDL